MDTLRLEPEHTPTAVFVKAAAGYQVGDITTLGPGEFIEHDRNQYYEQTHIQTIKFEIAKQIVYKLVGDKWNAPDPKSNPNLRLISRHQIISAGVQVS